MEKILKKGLPLCLAGLLATIPTAIASAAGNYIRVPAQMKPFTSLVYDEELNCVFSQGGKLKKNIKNNYINIDARPKMSVVYDKSGYIRNVYYPSPKNKYNSVVQLSDPLCNSYGTQDCTAVLGNSKDAKKGRITYYLKTDILKDSNDRQDYVKLGDCAVSQNIDNIRIGERARITNQDNEELNTKIYIYIKSDCRKLPDIMQDEYNMNPLFYNEPIEDAILGIFEDGNWTNSGIYGLLALRGNI